MYTIENYRLIGTISGSSPLASSLIILLLVALVIIGFIRLTR
jgi:hypothetical protein